MSKFASSSVLLLSLVMIAAGKLIPQIAILGFLAGFANIISVAGMIVLAIFLIANFGMKGALYLVLYIATFIVIQMAASWAFGFLNLSGLIFDLIALALAAAGTIFVANKVE